MIKAKIVIFSIIEYLIRDISGGLGQRIRFFYYSRRFKSCGRNVKIDEGVIIHNPQNIQIGNDVWIMPYSVITASDGNLNLKERMIIKRTNESFSGVIGSIEIGSEVQIGAYNIINGLGGIKIEDRVTTSARVSIYSFSHYPNDRYNPSKITYANSMVREKSISCIESPIQIEYGVWLGLNVMVFAGTIGKLCFVKANSIVLDNLNENSYCGGDPAKKIKNRFIL